MIVENPLALPYIFGDDIYVLQQEKTLLNNSAIPAAEPAPIAPEIAAPAITFTYTGGNQKKFLVLVHYPDHETMEQAHLSAFESTIKRKELSLDDVAILNLHRHAESGFQAIIAYFNPQKLLILGQKALPHELTSPPLNQLAKLDNCDTLYSFSFGEMMGNKNNTKAFWEQMKIL